MLSSIATSEAVAYLQRSYGDIGVELFYWYKLTLFRLRLPSFMSHRRRNEPIPTEKRLRLCRDAKTFAEHALQCSGRLRRATKLPRYFRPSPLTPAMQLFAQTL
jgi:hypothetical protein